jgi:hypothetical protein
MNHETANRIFEDIGASVKDDEGLLLLRRQLWVLAVRYARMRTDWRIASPEERRAMDVARSRSHDALIDQCNILSRAVAKAGRDNRWRAVLTDDRKEIGDFACHVHAILGVQAR